MIEPPGKPGIALYFSTKPTKTETYGGDVKVACPRDGVTFRRCFSGCGPETRFSTTTLRLSSLTSKSPWAGWFSLSQGHPGLSSCATGVEGGHFPGQLRKNQEDHTHPRTPLIVPYDEPPSDGNCHLMTSKLRFGEHRPCLARAPARI